MQVENEGRREDRLVSHDPAIMLLADGRRVTGHIGNMNLGGMLFVADELSLPLERDMSVEIVINLYGRESQFTCTVTYRKDNSFGLQLKRD